MRAKMTLAVLCGPALGLDFFEDNVTDWDANFGKFSGQATSWTPTPNLALRGQFAWQMTSP